MATLISNVSLAQAASNNAVAAGKLRDLALLWSSGLSSTLFSTTISDPFADEAADLEAQQIVARYMARSAGRQKQSRHATSKESEIMDLVQFQNALQTSSRIVSRIASLTSGFNKSR
jgi:flagellar hook-associated protein FlgK